ncbi:response regulator [Desulfarculus baarsii]
MSVVNIFYGSFCDAEQVALAVAGRLGYRLASDEDLIALAAGLGKQGAGALRRVMYGKANIFNSFSHEKERGLSLLKLAMSRMLAEDNLVFMGFGCHLTPKEVSHALRVCLAADTKFRVAKAVRELGLNEREAGARVHRDDEAAFRWLEYLQNRQPWDAALYDMLIPMDKNSVDQAVELICRHAASPPLQPTAASRQAAADFALAAQVEMALAEEGHSTRDLAVTVKGGRARVEVNKKVLMLGRLSDEVKRLVEGVDGVTTVEVEAGPGYHQADVYRRADFQLPSKVLLVDDEREFVQTLGERLLLREIGSAVVFDGEQALKVVAEDEPEVIVLDLKMPGIDGLEVLRRIKRDYPKVEVIILTGHGSERDRDNCLQIGAFAYLEKPVDIEQLSQTMQQAYDKIRSGQ